MTEREGLKGTRVARRLAVAAVAVGLLVLAPGCGVCTMRFLDQDIHVNSLPTGAEIWVDGQPTGQKTPAVVALPRAEKHTIWVQKEGYERPESRLLSRQVKDWIVFVDAAFVIVVIGVGFLLIDDALGADSDLVPDNVLFELQPLSRAPPAPGGRADAPPCRPLHRSRAPPTPA